MAVQQNKLLIALQALKKTEHSKFGRFLRSPYYNRSTQMQQLHDSVLALIEKDVPFDKDKIWKKIFNKEKYDDTRFRKLTSDLLQLLEQFLALQKYEENPINQAVHLMEAVNERKLQKLSNSTISEARRQSEVNNSRNANFYYLQYMIENKYYLLSNYENKRASRNNIEEIAVNLDIFYLSEKLRLYCIILSQKNVIAFDYHLLLVDEIIELMKKNTIDIMQYPPIAIYYQIFLLSTEDSNEEHYFKFKKLLIEFGDYFSESEANGIYTFAINYCIRKSNLNVPGFTKELHEINITMLEKGLLYSEEGELTPFRFGNIVINALRLGELNWVENFIKKYKNKVPVEQRDNVVSFNSASLYFYQKKYDRVIRTLAMVEYEDILMNLVAKSMLLATYYEIDETEPLYSLLESFRTFINRHKSIPTQRRQSYLNLIKYTKKLLKILPRQKKELTKIKEEVSKTNLLASKTWLLEKIAELE
ncbi:MAG: hypothetical protein KA974_04690 [Saprospiraceae bacterium]|nr:hypothetical protein [Saprospiraceae bacterium]MBP7699235.1 hypothetical protein [Saprospiraceae bacterium]